jgi:hypothetical protein
MWAFSLLAITACASVSKPLVQAWHHDNILIEACDVVSRQHDSSVASVMQ